MTNLDKFLVKWAPGWAERRAAARHNYAAISGWTSPAFGGGYAGGIKSRDRRMEGGYRSKAQDEDTLTASSLENMRLEAMDLYRNNPLCKSAVNGIKRYLGHSYPVATSAARAIDKAAAAKWDGEATEYFMGYFWNRADARRNPGVTFGDLQDYVTLAKWLTGDMAFVYSDDGLMPIEGERIATPSGMERDKTVVRGIQRRASDKRWTSVYICDRDENGYVDKKSYQRVPISSLIFCPWYWRPDQVRSVPALHSVVDALRDHEEIHGYTKNKVKHEGMIFTKEKAGAVKNRPGSRLIDNADGSKTEIQEVQWGMRVRVDGPPEDFQFANGTTPHAQYVPFLEYDGHLIAAGMGLPYEVVMHLYTNGSYTAQRSARMDFYHLLLDEHAWRNRVLNQRVWNVVITNGMKLGVIPKAPVDARGYSLFNATSWSLPHMLEIDIGKETDAQKSQWQLGIGNLEQFAREKQTTRADLLNAKRGDIEAAAAVAEQINKARPDLAITWRDIINAGGQTEKAVLAAKEGTTNE